MSEKQPYFLKFKVLRFHFLGGGQLADKTIKSLCKKRAVAHLFPIKLLND